MGVLWLWAKVQLRGRALASLFLALLVGLAEALVLAAAAGARRSEAALPRFLAVNRMVDSWVTVQSDDPADDLAKVRDKLAALPEVRQVFRVSGVGGLILAGADPAGGRTRSAGATCSARSPWTRAAALPSAVRSWLLAGCPMSADLRRRPWMRSWPSAITCGWAPAIGLAPSPWSSSGRPPR